MSKRNEKDKRGKPDEQQKSAAEVLENEIEDGQKSEAGKADLRDDENSESGGKTDDEACEYEKKIEQLSEQINDLNDKLLRLTAEYDNYKKRSIREKSDAYKDAVINSASELLTVLDNLERALDCDCPDSDFKKGVEMTYQALKLSFEKLGVTEIEAMGEQFDPNLHNAVSQVSDEKYGENTVCSVFQKGYKLGDKVVRHAMVAVANP